MSVDMQFLMQKTEPLHQQARLDEPRSAAEPRFGAIMADLLEQSEQENNAALPVGQEIAVTAEQRRKLRAERHDKAPELKPVIPAPQHELSEDASSELLGAMPVELTPVNTQPGQTKQDDILTILPIDEDLLNLIAVSEQYAVNLGVQDALTNTSTSLTASDAALLTSLDSDQTANSEDGKSQQGVLNSGVAASQAADKLAALAAQFAQGTAQGSAQQAALQHSQHMLNKAQDSAAKDALQLVTASLVQQAELHAAEQQAESTALNAASMTAGVNNLLLEQSTGLSDPTQSQVLSAAKSAAIGSSSAEQSALQAAALQAESADAMTTQAVDAEGATLQTANFVPVDTLHVTMSAAGSTSEVKTPAMTQASNQLQQVTEAALAADSAIALQSLQQTQPQLATVIVAPAMTQIAQLSFAEFQKAANAAQSQQQKQQQKAELVSGMPSAASIDTLTAMTQERLQQTVMPPVHEGVPASAVADKLLATIQSPASANLSQIQSSSATSSQATAQLATKAAEAALAPVFIQEPQAAQQLKERVMYQVGQKIQSAEVRLAPEELGSVQIKLNMQQEQLSVQFVVQQVQAKEALEQQMPRLRELLQQQGVELMDSQVSQQQQQQQSRQERSSSTGRAGVTEQDGFHDADKAPSVQVRYSDRVVDFYA